MAVTIREAYVREYKFSNVEYAAHVMEQIDLALVKLQKMDIKDLVETECYFDDIADGIKFLNEKIQLHRRME